MLCPRRVRHYNLCPHSSRPPRPAGVGRNSVRTSSQATVSANLSYSIGLGAPGGTRAQERGGGGERGDRAGQQVSGRYRVVFMLAVTNLTNRSNFSGFSGVRTSPFFLTPTSVTTPRRIDLGASVRF